MDTLIHFFTTVYHWTPEKAAQIADWMSQAQSGPDLQKKQVIAAAFLDWQLWQDR